MNNDHSRKKSKEHKESFLNLDDCINANYHYESLLSRLGNQPNSNKYNKDLNPKEDLVAITFG